ncbi:MAG: MFS transporter, partial [Frankiales bacterium]|nr:MFS transporter [Frankiales bacterium]
MFMTIMDTTIVNVALPQLGRTFHVPVAHVDTVVVGYLVSLAVFIPASGWLGDRFGTKRVFLAALVFFSGASALCGLAQSLGQLVGFRILQGVGGGMLTPVGLAMLYRTFRPHERVRASRILIIPTAFAPALGPVLGGLLVTDLSWRWAFYINVPIGLGALVVTSAVLKLAPGRHRPRIDWTGAALLSAAVAALVLATTDGFAHERWELVGGGIALAVAFVAVERRAAEPVLPLRLF